MVKRSKQNKKEVPNTNGASSVRKRGRGVFGIFRVALLCVMCAVLAGCLAVGCTNTTANKPGADNVAIDLPAASTNKDTHAEGEHTDYTELTYDLVEANNGTLEQGKYYLSADLQLKTNLRITGYVTLDLNGHILSGAAGSATVSVLGGGNFTLEDCDRYTTPHYFSEIIPGVNLWKFGEGNTETGEYTGKTAEGNSLMAGGIITNAATDAPNGTGIYVYANATATVTGGNISGNCGHTSYYGGGVYVNGGTFLMNGGGRIAGNYSARGGGIYAGAGSTISISGGRIERNRAYYEGGGIFADTNSVINLLTVYLQENTWGDEAGGTYYGGGIYANAATVSLFSGSWITGHAVHQAGRGGAAMYLTNKAHLNFYGGVVQNNTSSVGGNIMLANSTAYFEAGNIRSNSARGSYTAYALHVVNSTIKAQGGTIGGDSAQGNTLGGGVYLGTNAHLIASSSFSVRNNRNSANAACNIFAYSSSARISIENNLTGEIGITSFDGQVISTQWKTASNIKADANGYYFENDTKLGLIKFRMTAQANHAHTTRLTAAQLNASDTLAAGTYYITEDITLTRSITISGNVVLCLNGHKIIMAASTQSVAVGSWGSPTIMFTVNDGNTFNLYDCTEKITHDAQGYYTGRTGNGALDGNDGLYRAVVVNAGGIFNLYSGKITKFGLGAIRVNGVSAQFNMFGGALVETTIRYGSQQSWYNNNTNWSVWTDSGYVAVSNYGEFNLYDGEISGLRAGSTFGVSDYGVLMIEYGAILITGRSQFTMYGGKIANNQGSSASAFRLDNSSFVMYGGEISDHTAGAARAYNKTVNVGSPTRFALLGGRAINNAGPEHACFTISGSGSTTLEIGGSFYCEGNVTTGSSYKSFEYQDFVLSNIKFSFSDTFPFVGSGRYATSTNAQVGDIALMAQQLSSPVSVGYNSGYASTNTSHTGAKIHTGKFYLAKPVKGPAYNVGITAEGELTVAYAYAVTPDNHNQICGVNHANATAITTISEFCSAISNGGVYYLAADITGGQHAVPNAEVVICLNGHTITHHWSVNTSWGTSLYNGGSSSSLSIYDCKGTGVMTTSGEGQGTIISTSGTVNLFGGTFTHGGPRGYKGTYGTANIIYVANSTLNIYDGVVIGDYTGDMRSAVRGVQIAGASGIINMYGGEIRNNIGNWAMNGRGVYMSSGSTFNMYGGKITGNHAYEARGGGIYMEQNTTLNLYGGEISGNSADIEGGGIFMAATTEAVGNNMHLNIRGDVKIQNNTVGGKQNNIFLNAFGAITFMTEVFGGVIWLYPMSRNAFASFTKGFKKSKTDVSNHIKADCGIASAVIDTEGRYGDAGQVYWQFGSGIHDQFFPGNHAQSTDFNAYFASQGWNDSTVQNVTLSSGTYHLTGNLTSYKRFNISGTVNLCLNNYTLKYQGDSHFFYVPANSTLNLFGDGVNAKLSGGVYSVVLVEGNFTLYSGSLEDGTSIDTNTSLGYAGGVTVNGGTFTMMGGSIKNNNDGGLGRGGGVLVRGAGVFNMSAGEISGNTSTNGAGVLVDNNSTFTMTGGTINNNSGVYGGGVYVRLGTFDMQGGSIINNTARDAGGGVYLASSDRVLFNKTVAAKVTGNTLNNGTESNIYLPNGETQTITDGATIKQETIKDENGNTTIETSAVTKDEDGNETGKTDYTQKTETSSSGVTSTVKGDSSASDGKGGNSSTSTNSSTTMGTDGSVDVDNNKTQTITTRNPDGTFSTINIIMTNGVPSVEYVINLIWNAQDSAGKPITRTRAVEAGKSL